MILASIWAKQHKKIFFKFLTPLEVPTWPSKPFLYILYKFLYSLTVKKSKMTKKGYYFDFIYSGGRNVHKNCKTVCVFVVVGRFRRNVFISGGGSKSRILTPLWNKHILTETTKHDKNTSIFGSFMNIFSLNKKVKIIPLFSHFWLLHC